MKKSSKEPGKLKVYKISKPSNKDLYIVLLITLISLVVIVTSLNKYLNNTIFNINIIFSFLIIFLLGYAFWAAILPVAYLGKFKRLILIILFEILLITIYYFIFKLNPLNGYNINFFITLSTLISLLCIISFLRRNSIQKTRKKRFKNKPSSTHIKDSPLTDHDTDRKEKIEDTNEINKYFNPNQVNQISKYKPNHRGEIKRTFISYDLILVLLATVLCIYIIISPKFDKIMINTFLAIFLLLILPGYSLVAALYPKKEDLNFIERASMSLGFPLTVLAFGILIKNINPIAISLPFILLLIVTFTIVFIIVAYIRRQIVLKNEQFQKDRDSSQFYNEEEDLGETLETMQKTETSKIENEKYKKPKFVYLDLVLILLTTIITVIFINSAKLDHTIIRTILGIILVLFIPGYSLIAVLFPKMDDLNGIERGALSLGLSIAITPLVGLALNYTTFGINLSPILFSLSTFTIIMIFISYIRRRRVPEGEKFYVNFGGFFGSIKNIFTGKSKTTKILTIILILSIVIAITTTSYIIVNPKQGETFTEFYLLGPNGQASDYPTNITVGQNASVIIGIVNHEYTNVDYNLIIMSNGVTLKNENITLEDRKHNRNTI